MTIKYIQKNISAEPIYIITGITSNPNGILTVTKQNLHDESTTTEEIDLSKHKLQLKKLDAETDLTLMAACLTDEDTQELEDLNTRFSSEYNITFESIDEVDEYRKSKIFLTQHSQSNTEEGIYREHIWVEDTQSSRFEVIGSTKAVLEDYVQKSQTNGLLKNDGTVDTNTYLTTHQDISGKEDNNNKSSNITTDTGSTTKYPSVKAVEDYAEPKKEVGTLDDLATLISNASSGDTIVLNKDYKATTNKSITINKDITLIGNGHTIDCNNFYLSFTVNTAKKFIVTDCIFTNINISIVSYLFIKAIGRQSKVTFNNCIFKNSSIKSGLMMLTSASFLNIINCTFYNNIINSSASGILLLSETNFNIYNTIFEENTISPIYIKNTSLSEISQQEITECTFNNNINAITEESNNEYKCIVLKNNHFLQSGDTISGCTNNNYLTTHQDISSKIDSADLEIHTLTVEYSDSTTETITFLSPKQNNGGS